METKKGKGKRGLCADARDVPELFRPQWSHPGVFFLAMLYL